MASTSDSFEEVPAERRREFLDLQIIDAVLGERIAKKLTDQGFKTLGDLAVATEVELLAIKGFGTGALLKVYTVLGTFGFSLRSEKEEPLNGLVRLFRGIDFVPGKQMFRWVSGLDEASFTYLREKTTLGALSLTTRAEYLTWRRRTFPKRMRVADEQAELLAQGLACAGLTFSGEE